MLEIFAGLLKTTSVYSRYYIAKQLCKTRIDRCTTDNHVVLFTYKSLNDRVTHTATESGDEVGYSSFLIQRVLY